MPCSATRRARRGTSRRWDGAATGSSATSWRSPFRSLPSRLPELRRTDPQAKLATALLTVAREHGFPSWRALKAALEARQAQDLARFFAACDGGDLEALRAMLAVDPELVRAEDSARPHAGWTGLHSAARRGRADAVRLLLQQGADPDAREALDTAFDVERVDDLDDALAQVREGDADAVVSMDGDVLVARYTQTDQVQAAGQMDAIADFIARPIKKRDDYPEMPPQDYLDETTRLAVAEYMLQLKK